MLELTKHEKLIRDEPQYRSLLKYIRENQPVDPYLDILDQWGPKTYPKSNGPLTTALSITKVIIETPKGLILQESE